VFISSIHPKLFINHKNLMNEFDIKAADWEKNPMHWERSEVIAKEIKELIP
jgi:hypothetical protein